MGSVVFIVGTLLVLSALVWATYQSGKLLRSVPVRENLLLAPLENAVKAGVIALCVGLAAISGLPPAQFGWNFAPLGQIVSAGILVGLGATLVVNAITHVSIARFGKGVYSPVVLRNIFPRSRRDWLLVPAAMLLAVLLEEVLFRALLVGGMGAFAPQALLVVAGGLVFGLMHS